MNATIRAIAGPPDGRQKMRLLEHLYANLARLLMSDDDYEIPPMPEPGSPELDPEWCHTHSCHSSQCQGSH